MKNILLATIIMGILLYMVPSYATLNSVNSKADIYNSYNYTVQKMGLYPINGEFLDHFTIEANKENIKYKLGKYDLKSNLLEVVVNKSTNKISEINIISKDTFGFWQNEDVISKMIVSISIMNPDISLSKIYEIRNNLKKAYFNNKDYSQINMNDNVLKYTSYHDKTKNVISISLNKNNEEEKMLALNKK